MTKIPVSLIIDDPAPIVQVYHAHHSTGFTADGRPVIRNVPMHFTVFTAKKKRGIF